MFVCVYVKEREREREREREKYRRRKPVWAAFCKIFRGIIEIEWTRVCCVGCLETSWLNILSPMC